jgi:hypothetical protein
MLLRASQRSLREIRLQGVFLAALGCVVIQAGAGPCRASSATISYERNLAAWS